jgi:hypothetical protein
LTVAYLALAPEPIYHRARQLPIEGLQFGEGVNRRHERFGGERLSQVSKVEICGGAGASRSAWPVMSKMGSFGRSLRISVARAAPFIMAIA